MYKRCSVEGCTRNVVAKGLCDLHYRRQLHHGHVQATLRPKDWGTREKHPLHETWRWMCRQADGGFDGGWDDFWKFVSDVGERPSEDHRACRIDESKRYGPANFFWREIEVKQRRGESAKEYRRRYMREYRRNNPEKARNHDLKKSYGVTIEQYDAMAESQNHCCAICGGRESDIDNHSGRARRLAVDHCHKGNKVRGLLCAACNRGLGNFRDSPDLLRKAAAYLEQRENGDAEKSKFERNHYRLVERPGLQAMMMKWWDAERNGG